uniref:Cyclin-dependent kinase C-2 n=1 Tax=Aegilops tauschii TaxID=37682 RepID=M8B2Z3_AEGTA
MHACSLARQLSLAFGGGPRFLLHKALRLLKGELQCFHIFVAVAAGIHLALSHGTVQGLVRRCAQESVEKLFPYLERSGCAKKASSAAIDLFEKHILSVRSLAKLDPDASEAKETEAVHMLGAVAVLVPYLSKKARNTVFSGAYRLLRPRFSPLTRHVLRLMETLLEHLKAENIESELEKLISLVLAYLPYDEKKPDDTIIAALQLMRNCLGKLAGRPKLWTKVLPSAFEAVSGYLILDSKCSEDVAGLLIECIYSHVNQSIFVTNESGCDAEDSIDGAAVKSICSSINKKLRKCASPPRNVLTIVLAMFLKLGESSYVFMKDILLTLSRLGSKIHKEPHLKNVEECIGAAIVAMGPDKIHSLLPISFEEAWFTCSNMWIVPILNKLVYYKTASFLLSNNLSIVRQQLIDGTRRLSSSDEDVEVPAEVSALFSSKTSNLSCVSLQRCSKKDARKSMKVLASHSVDLLCTFADDFLESSEKRAHLKDALRSLAQISGSANICNLFLSLLKKCGLEDIPSTPENLECEANEVDGKGEENTDSTAEINNKRFAIYPYPSIRSLLMELISTLAEAADEDVLDLFFGFIKSSLLDSSKSCESKALFALSTILKEHHEYSLAQLDEIMMLLHGIKPDSNNAVLEGQLVCYKYLLVHMIKVNEESTSKKAFLILNELILALKSKKESRRLAYDVLLAISTSLRSSELNNGDSDLQRLFTMRYGETMFEETTICWFLFLTTVAQMISIVETLKNINFVNFQVMGYLSSPSPHIVSGAIAALSLLIYTDADFCVEVPNLIPSVLVLLQNKAIEVIKASLGFVKVLVTSLQSEKLLGLQADIMTGILPMSSVTKHHFKGKVILIVEILIRKCGFDAIDLVTPEKYKEFVRSVEEGRKGNNNNPADGAQSEAKDPEHHAPKRGKWAESNAESGQEEALTGKKEFFIKGAGKPHFQGGRESGTPQIGKEISDPDAPIRRDRSAGLASSARAGSRPMQVYMAKETETNEIVALKKIRMDNEREGFPITAIREIKILKKLHHQNVIQLKEIVTSPVDGNKYKGSIYMVFEYMDHDLTGLADRPGMRFTVPQIKCYMKQLLTGLHYCHVNQVLHRDIKGSNLLIDNEGNLKLADFGLARSFSSDHNGNLTNRVITLWYRPPELLLGSTRYGPAVDMWSVGCIFAELLNGKPILPGKNEPEQLTKIFELCGTPDELIWPGVTKMPCFDRHALDLLERMLTLDPSQRIPAKEALDAEYFWTDPLPCDPKSLPSYEASHEFQTKKKRQQQRQAEEAAKRQKINHPPPHSRLPPIQHPGQSHQIRPGHAPPVAGGPSHYAKPRGPGGPNRYPQGGNQGAGYNNPNRGGQGSGYGSAPYPQQGRGPPPFPAASGPRGGAGSGYGVGGPNYPPGGPPYGTSGPGRGGPNYPQGGSRNQQQYGSWQ